MLVVQEQVRKHLATWVRAAQPPHPCCRRGMNKDECSCVAWVRAVPIYTAANVTSSSWLSLGYSPCNESIILGSGGGLWVCSNYSMDPDPGKQIAFKVFVSVFQQKFLVVLLPFPNLGGWRVLTSSSLFFLQLTSSSLPNILSFWASGTGTGARYIHHHCAAENKGDLSTAGVKDVWKTVAPCSNMQAASMQEVKRTK